MITPKFSELYKKLNPKQKEAVDTIDGPVMVVAGPGTGKTQILTLRIANILLKTDTPADALLALTFTESGAHAMRKRLVEIIGTPAYKVHIHTFHGFCNEIIKKYPEEFPRIISSVSITEIDQIRIVEEIINANQFEYLKPYGDSYYYVRPILGSIRDLKREGVSPQDFKNELKKQHKELQSQPDLVHEKGAHKGKMKGEYKDIEKKLLKNEELSFVYEHYQAALQSKKLYDYEDMILEVVKVLTENADFLLMLQEQYQYILADEHQDTNNAQNKILELLANFHQSPNLFIVGDEKQAIFRFQGASLDNFLYFKNLYPDVRLINLEDNYRSTQHILDSAHAVIMNTGGESGKGDTKDLRIPLRSNVPHPSQKIDVYSFTKPDFEYMFLADDIKKKLAEGVEPQEIAVLYRDNKDVEGIARFFEKTDIPFVVESDQDILKSGIISKLILLIRTVATFGDGHMLARALHIDFLGLSPLDVYKVLAYASKSRLNMYDVLKSHEKLTLAEVEDVESFVVFFNKLTAWSVLSKNAHFLNFLDALINESGFLPHILKAPGSLENLHKLDVFFNEVRTLSESNKEYMIEQFISYLDVLNQYGLLVRKSGQSIQKGVRLMTAHKSKGLEFDYVYITGCFDGHWGNRSSRNTFSVSFRGIKSLGDKGNNDDERRLFFVALTRGRKHVVLTYSRESVQGKSQLPSQFISEIKSELVELCDVSHYEAAFVKNGEVKYAPKKQFGADVSDRDYLNHLFLEQGLSVTALNNYLECPWKYFYNNLVRIPRPQEKAALFGTAVHAALRSFFTAYKEDRPATKEFLLSLFEAELSKQPLGKIDFEESLEKGHTALSGYFDTYRGTWNKNILLEFNIKGVDLPHDGVNYLLKGNLDKVEIINADGNVNVVDYKTGKPKSRNDIEGKTASSDGNYKRQLVFYKLILDKAYEGKYRMTSGEIDFVEPAENGKYRKEKFDITDLEVVELGDVVKRVCAEIYNLSFWDSRCGEKDCEYCKLREVMG